MFLHYFRLYGGNKRNCDKCGLSILYNEHVLKMSNLVYHTKCFKCSKCEIQLKSGDRFGYYSGQILCEADHVYVSQANNPNSNSPTPNLQNQILNNNTNNTLNISNTSATGAAGGKRANGSTKRVSKAKAAAAAQQLQQQQHQQQQQQQQQHQQNQMLQMQFNHQQQQQQQLMPHHYQEQQLFVKKEEESF